MHIAPIDPLIGLCKDYTTTGTDPSSIQKTRQKAMNDKIMEVKENAIAILGLGHLWPIVNDQEISSRFDFLIVDGTGTTFDYFNKIGASESTKIQNHPDYMQFKIEGNPDSMDPLSIPKMVDDVSKSLNTGNSHPIFK